MTHEMLVSFYETYLAENEKFENGNKAAGTKEYRKMMELLEDSTFKTVGHMTSTKWNEGHSLIKIG